MSVPRDEAFASWTNLRLLRRFTKAEEAKKEGENKASFRSKIGPSSRSWRTEIVQRDDGRRVAWRSVGGPQNCGVVSFHELDDRLTRVMVEMEYHPKGFVEAVGNFLRMQRRRVRKDLRLFKVFVELERSGSGHRAPPANGSSPQRSSGARSASARVQRRTSPARKASTSRSTTVRHGQGGSASGSRARSSASGSRASSSARGTSSTGRVRGGR